MKPDEAKNLFFKHWDTIVWGARAELRHYRFYVNVGYDDYVQAAENLALDALVTIQAKAGEFDPNRSAFQTWASAIARYKAKDFLKHYWREHRDKQHHFYKEYTFTDYDEGRQSGDDENYGNSAIEKVATNWTGTGYASFEEHADAMEQDAVENAIARALRPDSKALPDEFRRVAEALYIQGLSYQSTADALGLDLGTVKSRSHRAKKLIKRISKEAVRELYSSPFKSFDFQRGYWFSYWMGWAAQPNIPPGESYPDPSFSALCIHGLTRRNCAFCNPDPRAPVAFTRKIRADAKRNKTPAWTDRHNQKTNRFEGARTLQNSADQYELEREAAILQVKRTQTKEAAAEIKYAEQQRPDETERVSRWANDREAAARIIRQALAELPAMQRRVFQLRRLGYRVQDIAEQIGESRADVWASLQAANQVIRGQLAGIGKISKVAIPGDNWTGRMNSGRLKTRHKYRDGSQPRHWASWGDR